jgi:hypothetical protein
MHEHDDITRQLGKPPARSGDRRHEAAVFRASTPPHDRYPQPPPQLFVQILFEIEQLKFETMFAKTWPRFSHLFSRL